MKKLVALLALLALAAFALAACGGDDDAAPPAGQPEAEEPAPEAETETPAPEPQTVQVVADPDGNPAFEQQSLEVASGEITFEFENPATVGHDFVIEDDAGNDIARTDVITDDSDSVTVELEPGEYTFYCSVPGHRDGGMLGQLTVDGGQGDAAEAEPPAEAPGY